MAFDFPAAPAVGDEFVSGGATYTFTAAGVWDLASSGTIDDKVDKAGDTMTGGLLAPSVKAIGDGTVGQLWLSPGDTTRCGNLEWRMVDGARQAYMGWGTKSNWINFKTEDGCKGLYMDGGADLFMGENSGIHWGNTSAQTDPLLMNEGICLYGWGTTSKFGFSITSGTLNYVVENVGNIHCFRVGAEDVMNIKSDGVRIPGGNLSVTGTSSFTGAISAAGKITSTVANGVVALQLNDGARIDFSSGCIISKVHGANDFQFHTNANQTFNFHISGFGDAWVIDTVGSTGNSVNVTAPESLAVAAELGVACDAERGVDLMKVIAALLLKVKALEARIK